MLPPTASWAHLSVVASVARRGATSRAPCIRRVTSGRSTGAKTGLSRARRRCDRASPRSRTPGALSPRVLCIHPGTPDGERVTAISEPTGLGTAALLTGFGGLHAAPAGPAELGANFTIRGRAEQPVWRGYSFRRPRQGRFFGAAVRLARRPIAVTRRVVAAFGLAVRLTAMLVAAVPRIQSLSSSSVPAPPFGHPPSSIPQSKDPRTGPPTRRRRTQ